ncbi:hypothetical protein COL154_013818 [Colletotrichum chrysophilum]|uniref:uncharacterized protein n=1 Tax=Colletotrichum chrysophilum TaxID=1836956 RepID=UPI002300EC61|nr:uncharacterized protein COL26b_014410 [Colletotrichum chrysophilum]KAJ0300086.1 hypothetical protein Brms1b_012950 [Colletotrichum noveboracense]KAJ0337350.1 hypothetical protein KNSL1_012923 [Colletotrichum chrysophilum]KAJ0347776.1 hypothetical protein COL154_013818 [Colletotrichum chrysophilum]KAJ0359096.1 hypothetical protein COL26b_014410 [Colletotrichum chrysophilum]
MPLDTPTYVLEDKFEPVLYEFLEAALTSVNKPSTDRWPSVWSVPRRTLFRLLKNTELLQWSLPRNYRILLAIHNIENVRHKLEAHGLGQHLESRPFVRLIPLGMNIYEWAQKEAETARGKVRLYVVYKPSLTPTYYLLWLTWKLQSYHIFAITSVLHAAKPDAWGPEVLRVAASGKGGTVYPAWARGTAIDPLCIDLVEGGRIVHHPLALNKTHECCGAVSQSELE